MTTVIVTRVVEVEVDVDVEVDVEVEVARRCRRGGTRLMVTEVVVTSVVGTREVVREASCSRWSFREPP